MKRIVSTVLLVLVAAALAAGAAGCGSEEVVSPTTNIDMARDEAVKAGIVAIDTGIAAYIGANEAAPPVADAATLGAFVNPWPSNPWTSEPMKPGTEKGDYVYQNLGGLSYSLVGHLSDGEYARP